MTSFGGTLLSIVERTLNLNEWRYDTDEEKHSVSFRLRGDHTVYAVLILVDEEREVVRCYARVDFHVPEEKRVVACEAITRATYGLPIGNFEMDMRDGEVRYKVSVDVEGGTLGTPMVDNMISAAVNTFDRYYPALMKVVYAGTTPEEAIKEVEQ